LIESEYTINLFVQRYAYENSDFIYSFINLCLNSLDHNHFAFVYVYVVATNCRINSMLTQAINFSFYLELILWLEPILRLEATNKTNLWWITVDQLSCDSNVQTYWLKFHPWWLHISSFRITYFIILYCNCRHIATKISC